MVTKGNSGERVNGAAALKIRSITLPIKSTYILPRSLPARLSLPQLLFGCPHLDLALSAG